MTSSSLTVAIPADHRLNRALQDLRLRQRQARLVAEFAREAEQPLPSASVTLAGDPARLRGIPAVGGRGSAGGAIRGSLPHVQAELLDLPAARALAVLVRDEFDGASPGTQPEEALLDAEALNEHPDLILGDVSSAQWAGERFR